MSKSRTEIIELMVNAFQDKNREMAAAAGMSTEDIDKHVMESNPSISFLQEAVYDVLAKEELLK